MKFFNTLLLIIGSCSFLFGQSQQEKHSTIGITNEAFQRLIEDESHGLAIDHFHKNEDKLLEFVFSASEIKLLDERAIPYTILVDDYVAHFQKTVETSAAERNVACGLLNFDDGDMGGYHTYNQMITHINSMQSQFPDLVEVSEVGRSIEDRVIYAIKISDDVAQDQSDVEGVVYFDALTHCREVMTLEATLYYMWWLLENYNTDPEATYLVNNREIYFIPVVNPDGFTFNEQIEPNGGGLWRKNRRDAGSGCFGVDLNRNYGHGWGLNSGSSNDPCTNTYRGTAPFSEPEAAAVRDFVAAIEPAISFTMHTYGDKFLSPFGFVDSLATYELYAEFVSEFIPPTYDGYGTTAKMLGYTSSGTTRDYFHSTGIPAWTPEIGHDFWEPPAVICDRVEEFLFPMKYLTWVAGNYACFYDFSVKNTSIWTHDTIALDVRVKNRGMTKVASDVSVKIESNHPSISILNGENNYGDIAPRAFFESTNAPFQFEVTGAMMLGEQIPFEVTVFQGAMASYSKTIYLTAGEQKILYQTDFEADNAWLSTASAWDTTFMDSQSGLRAFADSRYGNYLANTNDRVVLNQTVDLSTATHPQLSFKAKWSLEPDFDYVRLMVSTIGVGGWQPLEGLYTNSDNTYDKNRYWVQEFVSLDDFIGEPTLYFAFELRSDGGVHSDGFYVDDFAVSDFTNPTMVDNKDVFQSTLDWNISPNPNTGTCTLMIHGKETQSISVAVHDMTGQLLFREKVLLLEGSNLIPLDADSFPTGIYTVSLSTEGSVYQKRMLVE